jgi:hypothetical protein
MAEGVSNVFPSLTIENVSWLLLSATVATILLLGDDTL